MAVAFLTVVYVMGLLVCGSLNTITMKIAFTMSSTGTSGQEKLFEKPWFVTFLMFVGMLVALAFDRSIRRCEPCRGAKSNGQEPLIPDVPHGEDAATTERTWSQKVLLVAIPSMFDIAATGLCGMGFLYIPASVWQLLRGAEMVFTAMFSITFLKRKLRLYHWIGLMLCVVGIVMVGFASVGGESEEASKSSDGSTGGVGLVLFGMALALSGQVVQAAQVIAEEWLLKDVDLPGMQIIGFEGFWGVIIFFVCVFPLLKILPGNDLGKLEDTSDSLTMLSNDLPLTWMIVLFTFSCATYNMAAIGVTGALSALHRVMLEAFRTSLVWIFGLTVHYGYDPTSRFGEKWTSYSWLEVAGFVFLIVGQAIYGAMIMIPGIEYASPVEHMTATPGSLRNFTPVPPEKYLDDN